MDRTGHELLRGRVADWFPLLPRTRPRCRALTLRIDEIRELARLASHGTYETRLLSAAETYNKAALIVSDCGLADLAQQLCWRQFEIFRAAAPLTEKPAKLALQPIVNLGRLLIRIGHNARAYQIFQNSYNAVGTRTVTTIDGRDIDFNHLVDQIEAHQELRKFLWTALLADGTRALTTAGRWGDALRHVEKHKGIGKRMLDGRQVAILARCAAGDSEGAIDMLDDSSAPDPWEQAITTYLRTLCLSLSDRPTEASVTAMVDHYLQLEPTPGHPVFRTRLGLCVLDLVSGPGGVGEQEVATRVVREAVAAADAYVAWDVMSHTSCHLSMTEADEQALADVIECSGLHRGTMPTDLLDDLMASVRTSDTQLAHLIVRAVRGAHPRSADTPIRAEPGVSK